MILQFSNAFKKHLLLVYMDMYKQLTRGMHTILCRMYLCRTEHKWGGVFFANV